MGVDTTWVNPSAGGVLDLATGGTVTETVWDAIVSDLLHLGGTAGYVPSAALAAEAWTAFTPWMKQGAVLTLSTATGRYKRYGNLVVVTITAVINSAGNAGAYISVGDVPFASVNVGSVCWGTYQDTGTGQSVVTGEWESGTSLILKHTAAVWYGGTPYLGITPAMTAAAGDTCHLTIVYEAAS